MREWKISQDQIDSTTISGEANSHENLRSKNKSKKLRTGVRWQASRFFDNLGGGSNSSDQLGHLDLYLSPQNAARYLDVSVKFIYERIQSGEIASQAVGNRIKRIRKGILDEWLSAQAERQGR